MKSSISGLEDLRMRQLGVLIVMFRKPSLALSQLPSTQILDLLHNFPKTSTSSSLVLSQHTGFSKKCTFYYIPLFKYFVSLFLNTLSLFSNDCLTQN